MLLELIGGGPSELYPYLGHQAPVALLHVADGREHVFAQLTHKEHLALPEDFLMRLGDEGKGLLNDGFPQLPVLLLLDAREEG